MDQITELMARRDIILMHEYDEKHKSDDRYLTEHFANIVKRDCSDPSNWRVYFTHDNKLVAVLYPLDLRAVSGIWRVEHDCSRHENAVISKDPQITVYAIRAGEVAFKKHVCIQTFGYLMSKFHKSNITDYGKHLSYGFTMHHYKNAVPSWIAEATI